MSGGGRAIVADRARQCPFSNQQSEQIPGSASTVAYAGGSRVLFLDCGHARDSMSAICAVDFNAAAVPVPKSRRRRPNPALDPCEGESGRVVLNLGVNPGITHMLMHPYDHSCVFLFSLHRDTPRVTKMTLDTAGTIATSDRDAGGRFAAIAMSRCGSFLFCARPVDGRSDAEILLLRSDDLVTAGSRIVGSPHSDQCVKAVVCGATVAAASLFRGGVLLLAPTPSLDIRHVIVLPVHRDNPTALHVTALVLSPDERELFVVANEGQRSPSVFVYSTSSNTFPCILASFTARDMPMESMQLSLLLTKQPRWVDGATAFVIQPQQDPATGAWQACLALFSAPLMRDLPLRNKGGGGPPRGWRADTVVACLPHGGDGDDGTTTGGTCLTAFQFQSAAGMLTQRMWVLPYE